jgi:hypothetical protein
LVIYKKDGKLEQFEKHMVISEFVSENLTFFGTKKFESKNFTRKKNKASTVKLREQHHGAIACIRQLPHRVVVEFRPFSDPNITPWSNTRVDK